MAFTPNYSSQQDPAWKKEKLGFGSETIGTDGCALTSLTMLVNGFGYTETPKTLNDKLKGLGSGVGYIGPLMVWGALPLVCPRMTYKNLILCRDHDAPTADIDAAIARGQPVVVETDRSLASGLQNHWVVLYAKQGDDYLMLDPWPYPPDNKDTLLTVRYGFGRPAKKVITAVVWYDGREPQAEITPPPPPVETNLFVRVQADLDSGLRLRSQPTTASDMVAVLDAGTILRIIENENDAKAKIGVVNQWLRVRDPKSNEGYVAAWYVVNAAQPDPEPGPTPTPPPTPPPATDGMTVTVSQAVGAGGLRMRSLPSTNGAQVTIEPAGAILHVLEDATAAKAKIGVVSQWLNVKDDAGRSGYVAAWYVEATQSGGTPPPPPPPSEMRIYVSPLAVSGLSMRSGPGTGYAIVKILPASSPLTVLEPTAQADPKIGVFNQWIKVKDNAGSQGYVAAWYVNR